MESLPELLCNVQDARDAAIRGGHSQEDILVAAGMPRLRRVDREQIVAEMVIRQHASHPEDIDCIRENVNEILSLAGY